MIDEAILIRSMYDKLKATHPNSNEIEIAWRFSRLIGGLYYNDAFAFGTFKWNDVAGCAIDVYKRVGDMQLLLSEKEYFVYLGYTESEYEILRNAVIAQRNSALNDEKIDFAHQQITIAAKLAYYLDKDGLFSNIWLLETDLFISFYAGWLGDATILSSKGKTSFGNDDYMADLDAENLAYYIYTENESMLTANDLYYYQTLKNRTRAVEFLKVIPLWQVKEWIFDELCNSCDDDECMEELKNNYPETYNFIKSLENGHAVMEDYSNG